jgi:hypothetical protein
MEPTIDQVLAQIKAAHPLHAAELDHSLQILEQAVRDQAAAIARCNQDTHEPKSRDNLESDRAPEIHQS